MEVFFEAEVKAGCAGFRFHGAKLAPETENRQPKKTPCAKILRKRPYLLIENDAKKWPVGLTEDTSGGGP